MQEEVASLKDKLQESKKVLQNNEQMIRWLNSQVEPTDALHRCTWIQPWHGIRGGRSMRPDQVGVRCSWSRVHTHFAYVA